MDNKLFWAAILPFTFAVVIAWLVLFQIMGDRSYTSAPAERPLPN